MSYFSGHEAESPFIEAGGSPWSLIPPSDCPTAGSHFGWRGGGGGGHNFRVALSRIDGRCSGIVTWCVVSHMTCHVTVFIVCHSLLLGKFHNYTGILNFNFSHAQQNPCMYMCVCVCACPSKCCQVCLEGYTMHSTCSQTKIWFIKIVLPQ